MVGTTNPPRQTISRRRRLVFALVPLCALLLIAEVAIRIGRAPLHFGSFRSLRTDLMARNYPAELDPTLGYVPRPNFQSRDNHWGTLVSIDGDGMRRNGPGPAPPGDRVIATVGEKITQLTPSRGFAAELAAATTIVIASGTGMPVSTTHTLVGAVLGVGMARGIEAIDMRVVGRIFASWVVTIPVGAILSIVFFYFLKAVLP